jgi:hypothetical protein
MGKPFFGLIGLLIAAFLIAGCGEDAAPAADQVSEPEVVTETVAELSDTIVLPDGWEMIQAMSISDIEELVGATGYDTWHEPLSDAAGGKPELSFFDTTRVGGDRPKSKINLLVYTFDGESNFDRVSGYVNESVEVPGELWDRAIIGTMGGSIDDITVGMLIQRGDVCIRIKWSPEAYPEFDSIEFSVSIAERLIQNLYGG